LPDAGGSEESLIFGSVGAFATRSVAFIDVIVTDASYTSTPNSASESFTETWQFWGSGNSDLIRSPMLLTAFAVLTLVRRWHVLKTRSAQA
jgi:hypothetical protein